MAGQLGNVPVGRDASDALRCSALGMTTVFLTELALKGFSASLCLRLRVYSLLAEIPTEADIKGRPAVATPAQSGALPVFGPAQKWI